MFGFHTRPIISLLWLSSCRQASVLFLNSTAEGTAYSIQEHAREGAFHLSGAVKVLALSCDVGGGGLGSRGCSKAREQPLQ